MSDLESRLRALFNERSARRLAPASLLALSCGVALGGMVLGAPTMAAGAGLVIGGIAINIASSWIERLIMIPVEAEAARIELLEQGLEEGDPGALAVAAAALAAAGPQVAAALPEEGRRQLAASLGQGMAEAGGPLAALAPAYTAALQAPAQADWAAIRAEVQQQLRIAARVEAGERATIERSGIEINTTGASIDAAVIAKDDGAIRDSGITIRAAPAATPPPPPRAEPPPRTVNIGVAAGAGGTVSGSPASYIEHADQVTVQGHDPEAARREVDLLAYLGWMTRDCNALPLDRIHQSGVTQARAMELARVYIDLDTTDTVKLEHAGQQARSPGRPDDQRPLGAVEVLAHAPGARAMLLGAPGSGKSTFVNYLTYCLARAALTERRPAEPAPDAGWLSLLPRWTYGTLLPVPIILRDLAARPEVAAARRGSAALITAHLTTRLSELGYPYAAGALISALRAGRALLLLDGLDEVVGETVLLRVGEAILDAAKAFPGPILVTCRVLDYREELQRQLAGFAPFTLAELRDEQVQSFIRAWYAELAASGRRDPIEAEAATREMQGAVQSRDELRAMAGTPLLLTLMAQVHAFNGTLPDARALLYYACVDLLLLRWRQPPGEPELITRLGLSSFRSNDLLALMARLAYEAHTRAEREASRAGPADLDEKTVVEVLGETFAMPDIARRLELVGIVIRALEHGNGLLLKRGPQVYTFAHRTFQEFLAGYYLKSRPNALQLWCERARQLHWHEVLLLMTGYQVLGEQELERPLDLARKLLEDGSPQEQALAGEVLALVGYDRARGFNAELVARNGLWQRTLKSLREMQSRGGASAVPAALQHRAGLALGRLGYGELKDLAQPGGRPSVADPRLPLAVVGIPALQTAGWRKVLEEHYWCAIAPGPFWSGDDRAEQPRGAEIGLPYRIARYPVTNADYARFLTANGPDGYDPYQPWWTEEGRKHLLPGGIRFEGEPKQITHPRYWSVARYNGPIQPVVGVSWYEAAAYCRWLTAEGHVQGWLASDQAIRLPTWHEWERAARHTDKRRYPWGDTAPDQEHANYRDTGLGAPSPVGCFPAGMAVCGAHDMLGNVLEWTASPWQRWDVWQKDFTAFTTITLSWSAFAFGADVLCCGARDGGRPSGWYNVRSFRVVQSRALTE